MRIAVVSPHRILGGGETSVRNLIKHTPGHVWAVFFETDYPGAPRCEYGHLPNVLTVAQAGALPVQLRAFRPDLVLFYGSATPLALDATEQLSPRPKRVFLAKTSDKNGTFQYWHQCRDQVDAAVAVSPEIGLALAREEKDLWPGYRKVRVIPQGVDREIFKPAREHDGSLKTVGYCGRVAGGKGLDGLPRALAGTRLTLHVAGPKGKKHVWQRLEKDCRRWKIKLQYSGPEQYPVKAYHGMDLLVLMSDREGCPNAVTEAAACGVPTVATRVGTLPDYWTDEENIFFVDHPRQLRSKLRRLQRRPDLVAKVARGALARAEAFDAGHYADKYNRLFTAVAEGRLPAPKGHVLGRTGGCGDVLCAGPLAEYLGGRFVPFVLNCPLGVRELLTPNCNPVEADQPQPLTYRKEGGHVADQYARQVLGFAVDDAPLHVTPAPKGEKTRVGIHAYVKKAMKQWPLSRWGVVARALREQGFEVVQLDPGPRIEGVDRQLRVVPVAEYAAHVASCDVVVTVEGFPHHLAHALRVPAVVLWPGSVRFSLTGYDDQTVVKPELPCACDGATHQWALPAGCPSQADGVPPCMAAISPEAVFDAVDQVAAREEVPA